MPCAVVPSWEPLSNDSLNSESNQEHAPRSLSRPSQTSPSSSLPFPMPKKRASRVGTRSVTALSAMQLERKRANDREAQRAIRQRTKDHIDHLEQSISELRAWGRSSEQLFLVARHQNRELEDEVAFLRRRLKDAGLSPGERVSQSVDVSVNQRDTNPSAITMRRDGSTRNSQSQSDMRFPCTAYSATPLTTPLVSAGTNAMCGPPNPVHWQSQTTFDHSQPTMRTTGVSNFAPPPVDPPPAYQGDSSVAGPDWDNQAGSHSYMNTQSVVKSEPYDPQSSQQVTFFQTFPVHSTQDGVLEARNQADMVAYDSTYMNSRVL